MIMTQSSLFVVNNMKSGSAHGLRNEKENRNPGPSLTILFFLRWQIWRGYVEQRKANDLFKRRSRFHGRCLAIYTAIPSSKRSKPKVKLSHGMRNELSRSKEVTPDRSWLHLWLRGTAFSRSLEHLGRREAGGVRSRHRVPALLIHERGRECCVEKAS